MIILEPHGQRLPSVLLSALEQDFYATPAAQTQPSSPHSCAGSTAEHFNLEQAMTLQRPMIKDAPSPRAPSALPADAAATVTGTDIVYLAGLQAQPVKWPWQHRPTQPRFRSGKLTSISLRNRAPLLDPLSCLAKLQRRSTGQDGQINYLATLAIFVKQTTYLATLPNPDRKANQCPCF